MSGHAVSGTSKDGLSECHSLDESYEYCRRLTRQTAHNFRFSFLTLPRRQRRSMNALYAFNRITDDLGDDESRTIEERRALLFEWRSSLHQDLSGNELNGPSAALSSCHRALPAIADIVRQHQIPQEYLFAVIDGVEMDLSPNRAVWEVATFTELQEYCYHVAGAVGLSCLHVWGFRDDPAVKGLAIDCGLALQLTNILRDLGEDAARGRIYLPKEDLDRFGYTANDLRQHVVDDRFRELMRFEVARAKEHYRRGEELFQYLEPPGKPILRAMLDIYSRLLHEIERHNGNVFDRRISLPKWKKLALAAKAIGMGWLGR